MSQITLSEKKKNEGKSHNNLLKMLQEKENRMLPPDRIMVKSLSTGKQLDANKTKPDKSKNRVYIYLIN